MKAIILVNPYACTEQEAYQPRRIAEELTALGVEVQILKNAWQGGIGETFQVPACDFAVCLDKDKYFPRMLEAHGIRLFNCARAVELCDDKLLTMIALEGKVPMPETIPAPLCYRAGSDVENEFPAERLGYPLVVKECYGSFGKQVYLARNREALFALQRKLCLRPHLYQKFIAESAGRDLRVIAVGGEPVAAMRRINEGDFRSNLALGGRGEKAEIDGDVRTLCKIVTDALGLDYCGIDLLFGREGYLVCEVNSNAFFGGIERVTHVNVARIYAEYMLRFVTST